MWKPKHHPVALALLGVVLTGAVLLCSCDEVEQHRVLTFFFDGVPPLHGQRRWPERPRVNPADVSSASATSGWIVHKAISDCTQCHGTQQRRSASGKVRLEAEIPQLCYKCHTAFAHLQGWVHGPVAVGECLLCHEPHKSRNESLLVKPVPELCYRCHDSQAIHQIENHAQESYAHCNDCHEGHASATRNLLKPAVLTPPATPAPVPEAAPESETPPVETPPVEAPPTVPVVPQVMEDGNQPRSIPLTPTDRYNRSVQAYHAGRFDEARAGFLEVVRSRSAPQSMRDMAKDYVEKIDWLQKKPQTPQLNPPR